MEENITYDIIVRHLTNEEGEGYLAFFPDIPGCFADGDTPEEAVKEAKDALKSLMQTAIEFNDPIQDIKK